MLKVFYHHAARTLVRRREDFDWAAYRAIRPYRDPGLSDPRVALEAAARMWDSRMLAFSPERKEEVAFFTMAKKYREEGGVRQVVSRIVWDERRANLLFKAASFAHWDLASETLGSGQGAASFTADLPDRFYRVSRPALLLKAFVKHMKTTRDLDTRVPLGGRFLALSVLPMGWSRAPFIAHTLMLDVFESAVAPWCCRRVEDGRPTLRPGRGGPVHWGYMGDFGALIRVPSDEPLEEPRAARASRCRPRMRRGQHLEASGNAPHRRPPRRFPVEDRPVPIWGRCHGAHCHPQQHELEDTAALHWSGPMRWETSARPPPRSTLLPCANGSPWLRCAPLRASSRRASARFSTPPSRARRPILDHLAVPVLRRWPV